MNPSGPAEGKSSEDLGPHRGKENALVFSDPARRLHSSGDNISVAFFPARELYTVKAGVWVQGDSETSLVPYIGSNAGFDSSAAALATTFDRAATRLDMLKSYQKALGDVRKCISNPASALTVQGAHAVYFLQVCHACVAGVDDRGTGHMEGLAQLGKALTDGSKHHELVKNGVDMLMFEIVRLYALETLPCLQMLTTPQANEALFNPDITVPPWIHRYARKERPEVPLTASYIDKRSRKRGLELAADIVLRHDLFHKSLYIRLPDLMRGPLENIVEVRQIYELIRDVYPHLKVLKREESAAHREPWPANLHTSLYHEAYCAAIAIGITFNVFLAKSYLADRRLVEERAEFCADAVTLGQRCTAELPIGGHHAPPALMAAWLATDRESERARLQKLLDDYQGSWNMRYVRYNVRIWPEAPPRLKTLPWFPRGAGRLHRQKGSPAYAEHQNSLEVYETCCIL